MGRPVRVNVNIDGSNRLVERWNQRVNFLGGKRVRSILQEMGHEMEAQFQKNIEKFVPGPVKDLTPKYKKRKMKDVGHVYPILIKTGQMFASMYSRVFKKDGWTVKVAFAGMHEGGITNQRLVGIHTGQEPGKMPVRDFMKLRKGWTAKWTRLILRELKRLR